MDELSNYEEVDLKDLEKESPQDSQDPRGRKPDFRVVQIDRTRNGEVIYRRVGGMWKQISNNGKEYYVLRIGKLLLYVFKNER
jgi:uncharacterized protein (DUF736 family)